MLDRRTLFAAPSLLATPARAQGAGVWSAQYTAVKPGGVKLAVYRKRLGAPDGAKLPVLVLVHGSSASGKATFDLEVPGRADLSLMNVTAGWGYDVWVMDHEGYGNSDRTAGNSDIASGVEDLKVLGDLILAETGQARVHMMGESSGALRVGAYAMARPDRVGRLVLQALTYTGRGSPTLGKRGEQAAYYKTHARRPRDAAMLQSIFTRDKPGTTDDDVIRAFIDAEMKFGDSVPAGTYLDMTVNLPVVQPERVHAPALLISGEFDGIASLDDICDFFKKLPSGDKQLTIVPGAAHTLTNSKQRATFWRVMRSWLEG